MAESNSDLVLFFEPVRVYLEDDDVSEIPITGSERIYFERKGKLELTPAKFVSEPALKAAATKKVGPTVPGATPEKPISRPASFLAGRQVPAGECGCGMPPNSLSGYPAPAQRNWHFPAMTAIILLSPATVGAGNARKHGTKEDLAMAKRIEAETAEAFGRIS
ncbi:MAG: hypothetical protein WC789_04685 [Lentisphaeria bacterium]